MPKAKQSNVLSRLEICCPIVCATAGCTNCGKPLNSPVIPADEEDSFYENYGQGGEDGQHDICKTCKELGLLEDPLNLLLYTILNDAWNIQENHYIAIQFTPELIDALVGLLNNFNEGKPKPNESVFGTDATGFDYYPNVHIYNVEEFAVEEDFDFQKDREFDEMDKTLVCSKQGVCFQVQYRPNGAEVEESVVERTCWFDMADLLALRAWLKSKG